MASALAGGLALIVAGVVVVYRARAAGDDATVAVPVSSSPSVSTSPVAQITTVDPAIAVRAAVAGYLAGAGTHAALALLDQQTGEQVLYNESVRFETASVVKVDILATLLYQHQQTGTTLSADERDTATAMITQSDNDAASDLWDAIGGASGLAAANKVFGLTRTTPGDDGYWGLTTTTAADQVRLLKVLTADDGPLTATSRGYELGLMARVEGDQRWGVPDAASDQSTEVEVKNGWLSRSADGGLWIVNTVGRIVEPGHEWLVVVLSSHHASEDAGIAMVEHAADLAVQGLRAADS
jgi:beta-lactamase class A